MPQIHKRQTDEQIRSVLAGYVSGELTLEAAALQLGVGRSRFFALLSGYRRDPAGFSVEYRRSGRPFLSADDEAAIRQVLLDDKRLVDDPDVPVRSFNYAAARDRLEKDFEVKVSRPTVVARAKAIGCYAARRRAKAVHDRVVLTDNAGELVQHDSSHHLFAPDAGAKWHLITSIDDHSRFLLFAGLFDQETAWRHILAAQSLVLDHGCPLNYYVDNHSIFRYVERRGSIHGRWDIPTDGVDTQWKQALGRCGVGVIYASGPQAKGKVERPYGWLQDRLVRTCAREKITRIDDGRAVLRAEVERYNCRQVHSTTLEIPAVRLERAAREGRTCLRPFEPPAPARSVKDVFCLREERVVDAYRRISLFTKSLRVPKAPPRETVAVNMVPDAALKTVELRMWWRGQMVDVQHVDAADLKEVHF